MIALFLATSAWAIPRDQVLDHAAAYAAHTWTMAAVNETASCDSAYTSDYTPGTYVGLPYDWGGWVTLDEYDAQIASGEGAGSHSWDGILSCTTGVDCSGYVSQTWETDQHYSTAMMPDITTTIAQSDLLPGDALDDYGSHIVLFTYVTAGGNPVFYEASGSASKVRIHAFDDWSYLSGYQPIRYQNIEPGNFDGTKESPREISAFPFEDFHWTAGTPQNEWDSYSCGSQDESGPEVVYHFYAKTKGSLDVVVSDDTGVDIDVHVLTAADPQACVARNDTEVTVDVGPGDVWLSLDTYVSTQEWPGPYLLDATFTGQIGVADASGGDTSTSTGSGDDTAVAPSGDGNGPGHRISLDDKSAFGGCGCASTGQAGGFWLVAAAALVARRRRQGVNVPSEPAGADGAPVRSC